MKSTQTKLMFDKRVVFTVAFIIFARMSALFFPLPIFSPLASNLENASAFLVGLAIGIYALMQALLQIPLGLLSDRLGRKKVIVLGLFLFVIGSLLCSISDDIHTLILARFIQGLGAVSSTLTALIGDQTHENHRAKAMAIIGASVGVAFFVGTVSSPLIANYFGFSEVFYLISFFALLAFALSFTLPSDLKPNQATSKQTINSSVFTPKLIFLDFSVFIGHFILSANFFILPFILIQNWGVALSEHWKIYLFVLVFAIPAMIYTVFLVDKQKRISRAFYFALLSLVLCHAMFYFHQSLILLVIAMLVFFSGFSSLETLLPTLTSQSSNPSNRGFVMGVFSTSQQLGSAFGALVAGLIGYQFGILVFVLNLSLVVLLFGFGFKIYPQFDLSKHKIAS